MVKRGIFVSVKEHIHLSINYSPGKSRGFYFLYMNQNYELYTNIDREVWHLLFNRQVNNLQGKAASVYFEALETIGFTANKIPLFSDINQRLKKSTGWSIEVVPAIVPERQFFEMLSQKKFPATTWLRKPHQLDYLEEPDMFHDVFGHVPLLTNHQYVSFFKGVADIALHHFNNEKIIHALGRLYWFTIEFGLIEQKNGTGIYGAGIISSFGETNHCLKKEIIHHPFNVENIMTKNYINSEIQQEYFVIKSLDQLYRSLEEVKLMVNQILLSTTQQPLSKI